MVIVLLEMECTVGLVVIRESEVIESAWMRMVVKVACNFRSCVCGSRMCLVKSVRRGCVRGDGYHG